MFATHMRAEVRCLFTWRRIVRKFASRAALAASMTLMSLIAAGTAHAQVPDMLYAQNNRAVPGGYQSRLWSACRAATKRGDDGQPQDRSRS